MNSKIIYELSISFYNKVVVLNFDLQSTLVNLALQEIKVNKVGSVLADANFAALHG